MKNHCLLHDEMENIFKDELIQRVEVAVENKAVTMQTVEAKKNSYFQGLKKIVNHVFCKKGLTGLVKVILIS